MILDLHTHRPTPYPEGIISVSPEELPDISGVQAYSVGYHPWSLPISGISEEQIRILEKCAERQDVVAIGECGVDLSHPGVPPLAIQMITLRKHIEVSERVEKPLILHCVKGHDAIIGMRQELNPRQRWIIHGFRGKPTILQILLKAGIDVSYGERFNPDSVAQTPADRLFAETDESHKPILEIIDTLRAANPVATPDRIARNIFGILHQKDDCKIQ